MPASVTLAQTFAWIGGALAFLILVAASVERVFSPLSKLLRNAITAPLVEKLEEQKGAFDEHARYVGYHLGPNGDALPIHMRLTNVEEALRFAALEAREFAVTARETAQMNDDNARHTAADVASDLHERGDR